MKIVLNTILILLLNLSIQAQCVDSLFVLDKCYVIKNTQDTTFTQAYESNVLKRVYYDSVMVKKYDSNSILRRIQYYHWGDKIGKWEFYDANGTYEKSVEQSKIASFDANYDKLFTLNLIIDLSVEGNKQEAISVEVKKNGKTIEKLIKVGRWTYQLEKNKLYLLSFKRKGYHPKVIQFDTRTKEQYELQPFLMCIRFSKSTKKQKPELGVGFTTVRYSEEMHDFDYDVNYTKSIVIGNCFITTE